MKRVLIFLLFVAVTSWSYAQTISGTVSNASCNGAFDGAVDITVTGGTVPYAYDWEGPSSFTSNDSDIVDLQGGWYYITVTDDASSTVNDSFFVAEPERIELTIEPIQETCVGTDDGQVKLTITSGGIAPFTYLWSNGDTSQNLSNLSGNGEGGYMELYVTVTDASGCQETGGTMLDSPMEVYYNVDITNPNCGAADGEASIENLQYDIEEYSIMWNTGDTTSHIYGLLAGLYSVEVKYLATSCSRIEYFYVENASGITVTPTVTNASKPKSKDGVISLDISGGTYPYGVLWENGKIGTSINNLYSGSYSATITDAQGCLSTTCVYVGEENDNSLQVFISREKATSCSGSDGSAEVFPSGGVSPYTFQWDDDANQTDAKAINLSAGVYHCTVTDNASNQEIVAIAVGDVGGPSVFLTERGSAFCGESNGYLKISVSGGTEPYTYEWSNGTTNKDLLGVEAGPYCMLVADNGGCHSDWNNRYVYSVSPTTQPICIVTVDSSTNHNLVVWENIQTTGIDHYNIYRQSCDGGFSFIGSVSSSSISVFEDLTSQPFMKSYAYKISSVDNCGEESTLSPMHKTIHLGINLDADAEQAQLIWDDYMGFPNPVFKIYKKTTDLGWVLVKDVSFSDYAYIDSSFNDTTISYAIIVEKPEGEVCDAWNGNKASGGPYYQSSSNIEDEGIVDHTLVEEIQKGELAIYPNPTHSVLNIENTDLIYSIKLYDISGKLIVSYPNINQTKIKLNTQNFEAGIYILEIESSDLIKKKIIIE